jgi:hypothetical protein
MTSHDAFLPEEKQEKKKKTNTTTSTGSRPGGPESSNGSDHGENKRTKLAQKG